MQKLEIDGELSRNCLHPLINISKRHYLSHQIVVNKLFEADPVRRRATDRVQEPQHVLSAAFDTIFSCLHAVPESGKFLLPVDFAVDAGGAHDKRLFSRAHVANLENSAQNFKLRLISLVGSDHLAVTREPLHVHDFVVESVD